LIVLFSDVTVQLREEYRTLFARGGTWARR
jgi:hypothetical protein